jgi:16S rRNA (cytidine1402-2'-O)-methyltransferase
MIGRLYLVATPIGHLGDVSDRMREVLSNVDLIAAEDTRRTGMLLKHMEIKSRLTSYHDHNERRKWPDLVSVLESGQDVAVVSDAGTPGIADPGWHIIQAAIERQIEIIVVPGPTAFVPALLLSGLRSDRFTFEGYLPRKPGKRRRRLTELSDDIRTMIFYETPHRVRSTVDAMVGIFGPRPASFSRELTKLHETTVRGTLVELAEYLNTHKTQGEYVVVVAGKDGKSAAETSISPDDDEFHEYPAN